MHPTILPDRHGWRPFLAAAAALVVAAAVTLGIVIGLGELVIRYPGGNLLGDITVPAWFAAHRTPALTQWSLVFTDIGSVWGIVIVGLASCVVFVIVTRRWRSAWFVAVVMLGEISIFLIATMVTDRPRPPVPHLDPNAGPTSFPSGHTAASSCLYLALAIVVIGYGRGWWRWLALIPGIAIPALVATSRLYRGEHHPTDLLGSAVLAALWLTATTKVLKPGSQTP